MSPGNVWLMKVYTDIVIRQRHVDNDQDPEVSTTSELFALANGPSWTPISINSCVVDGVRYVVHSRDERRTTQNSGICSPGPDGEMYYGQLQEIIEFKYLLFKVALFRVKWFDTSNKGRKVKKLVLRNNMTQIDCSREAFKDDQYILVTQVKQVFYLEDKTKPHWKVVEHVNHKKFSDEGVIVVEDDPDIIHFDNSSDLPLSTSLNDLDNATLHIDGQSTVVDTPPDIIDVPNEDDDIIGDEDALPCDLADSDVEELINVDDDGVEKMSSADVARSHGGDGGGDDHPSSHVVPTGYGGCFANNGKGKRKPNLGGRGAGRLNTSDKTQNLSLKEIAEAKGPVSISFEYEGPEGAEGGDHFRDWGQLSFYTLFDLRPHMDSSRWTEIYEGINMHLQKAYNTNKASFKAKHRKADPTTGTYDVEAIRRAHPEEITVAEWDKYIKFWNDPKNLAQAAQNQLNRQKSVVISRQGSRSLARLRDEMRQASDTQEYPSLIDTFWRTHTVDGVFPKDEDRRIYEEMKRLEATGEYTEDEINALARGGKLRGHIPGVGWVLPSRATSRPSMPAPDKSLKSMHRKVDFMMSLFRSDSKYSDMFKEFESGGASGSGGCGDDEESGDDEDDDGESPANKKLPFSSVGMKDPPSLFCNTGDESAPIIWDISAYIQCGENFVQEADLRGLTTPSPTTATILTSSLSSSVEHDNKFDDLRLKKKKQKISSLISLNRESFDVIVGMDWLSKRKFVIVCYEKVVRISLEGDEILRVHGEHLVPEVMSVVKSRYRLAPLEMEELSEQLRELQNKVLELLRKEKLYVKVASVRAVSEELEIWSKRMILVPQVRRSSKAHTRRKASWVRLTYEKGKEVESLYPYGSYMSSAVGNDENGRMDEAHCIRSHVLWVEIRESSLIGPYLVQETTDKAVLIKEKLKAARDRQKSYADNRRKPLEFEVGDRVMLTVSPWKGVIRFGKNGKLALRYVGPFEIFERIGLVAYQMRLPEELSGVYYTFHVSNLKKCLADASLLVPLDEIKVDKTLPFVEEAVENSDREVKKFKCSRMVVVKVYLVSK
ncbi:F-box domain containing protein [Tanacetum coccineum]